MKKLSDLDKSGWENGEEIKYDWVKGNFKIPEQLIDIVCVVTLESGSECKPIRVNMVQMNHFIHFNSISCLKIFLYLLED